MNSKIKNNIGEALVYATVKIFPKIIERKDRKEDNASLEDLINNI